MSNMLARSRAKLLRRLRTLLKISKYPMRDSEMFIKYLALLNKHKQEALRHKLDPINWHECIYYNRDTWKC